MPIEVPDTRAFADPPPRRRRATAKPAVPVEVAAEAAVAEPESAFRKPVRRRKPPVVDAVAAEATAPPEPVVAEPVVAEPVVAEPASAFSRPVRRRPKPEAVPAEPSPAAVPPAVVTTDLAPTAPLCDDLPSNDPAATDPLEVAIPAPRPVAVEERRGAEGVLDEVVALTDTVVVRLAGTRYAVAMDAVAEVGRPPHVTRVPGVPAWIAGVANWRGRIMPVLDLRVLLGAATPELGLAGRIMVLARDGVTLAFLAERVEGVVSLELDSLEPVLLTLSRTTASVLAGQLTHPDGPIALLDLDTLFGLRSQLPRVRRAG